MVILDHQLWYYPPKCHADHHVPLDDLRICSSLCVLATIKICSTANDFDSEKSNGKLSVGHGKGWWGKNAWNSWKRVQSGSKAHQAAASRRLAIISNIKSHDEESWFATRCHAQRVRCLLFGSLLWLSVGLYQAFAQ